MAPLESVNGGGTGSLEKAAAGAAVPALGGGYLASGPADRARLPRPFLPAGLRLDKQEGAGEVPAPLLGAAADRAGLPLAASPDPQYHDAGDG